MGEFPVYFCMCDFVETRIYKYFSYFNFNFIGNG